jgi:hypothetical protein
VARKPSFNFGANAKPKKAKKSKKSKGKAGGKSNAWRKYVGGISNAPIPD